MKNKKRGPLGPLLSLNHSPHYEMRKLVEVSSAESSE